MSRCIVCCVVIYLVAGFLGGTCGCQDKCRLHRNGAGTSRGDGRKGSRWPWADQWPLLRRASGHVHLRVPLSRVIQSQRDWGRHAPLVRSIFFEGLALDQPASMVNGDPRERMHMQARGLKQIAPEGVLVLNRPFRRAALVESTAGFLFPTLQTG